MSESEKKSRMRRHREVSVCYSSLSLTLLCRCSCPCVLLLLRVCRPYSFLLAAPSAAPLHSRPSSHEITDEREASGERGKRGGRETEQGVQSADE